jgi:iron-sulfur cluster repair protein YtfE (RIC family)
MLLVHRVFRREFSALARAATQRPDVTRTRALDDQLGLILRGLHHHHTGEDTLLWPSVRQRCPEAATVLDAMEAEHDELDPLIRRAGDTDVPFTERAEALASLSERLGAHLDREEREALPLLERHMPVEEYAAVEKEMLKRLGSADLPMFAGAVLSHTSADERRSLFATMPRVLHVMWLLSWRRKYARRYARTYGRPAERVRLQATGGRSE